MAKIKVIEIEAIKLDPKAAYLVILNYRQFSTERASRIAKRLLELNPNVVTTVAPDPESAVKVYQIPRVDDGKK